MADVIAKMSYMYFNHQCWFWYGRCYCQVADGITALFVVLADVIAKWQMEWPPQGWKCWQMLLPCGRLNSHWVLLFQFKFWGVKQNLIPYVRQMVFTYVFI